MHKTCKAIVAAILLSGMTSTGMGAGYRIINDVDGEGWKVVSEKTGRVMAESDEGELTVDGMPEMMRMMIENMIRSEDADTLPSSRSTRAVIAPLTSARWNQDAPYNMMCPKAAAVSSTEKKRTKTGCGATAMAEMMHYWKHPTASLPALDGYTVEGRTVSGETYAGFTVEALGGDVINWEMTKTKYQRSDSATEEGLEVAKLMRYCGQSVEMQYGVSASSSNIVSIRNAMVNDFDYSSDARIVGREMFSSKEWEELIYGELSAGRPVMMDGTSRSGGHVFICDGYKDGKWHIDWGWSGVGDGYFAMTALDPNDVTNGYASFDDGYTYGIDAIVGLRPADSKNQKSDVLFVITQLVSKSAVYEISSANKLTIDWNVENRSSVDVEASLGIAVYDINGNMIHWRNTSQKTFPAGVMLSSSGGIIMSNFGASYPDGKYTMHFIYISSDDEKHLAEGSEKSSAHLTFTKQGSTIKFSGGAISDYDVKSISMEGPTTDAEKVIAYRPVKMNVELANMGNIDYGILKIYLNDDTGVSGRNLVDLDAGETGVIPLTFVTTTEGVNTYKIVVNQEKVYEGMFTAVAQEPADLRLESLDGNYGEADEEGYHHLTSNRLTLTVEVGNVGDAEYDDVIAVKLMRVDCDKLSSAYSKEQKVKIPVNEAMVSDFDFEGLEAGASYQIRVLYVRQKGSLPVWTYFSPSYMRVDASEDTESGLTGKTVENSNTSDCYDVTGRRVDGGNHIGVMIRGGKAVLIRHK